MSTNAGNLLWNRRRITLSGGATDVDTGLTQPQQGFGSSSANEPPLGIAGTTPPADGTAPASRVQVCVQAPVAGWTGITHGEPWFDTTTGTVHVEFHNINETPTTINVLFWDPSTLIGPGQADTYNAPLIV